MSSDAPDSFEPGAGIMAEAKNVRTEDKVEQLYINYAIPVIAERTLPDVRNGLKPVHRHILYAMYQAGVTSNSSHRKSSSIVGETMGDYHPHGDSAICDTLARMMQDFSMRYPLVDGQGNFGSVDGDPPAAMRYTEARVSPIAEEFLDDIDKDAVDSQSNYDDRKQEPTVLPSSFPNLLANGSFGVAVGVSTNTLLHNLGEVVGATVELIENLDATVADLMEHIKGPDFPTGANIVGRNAVHRAYKAGHGRVRVCADYDVFKEGGRVVINELPYQENRACLIERTADDVNEGKTEGVRDIRDEFDRDGIRVVIKLKCGVMAEVVKNQLLDSHLESTSDVTNLVLVDGQPQALTLKEALEHYLDHRHDVVRWRSEYEPAEAEDRAHILDDRLEVLDNIDDVAETIRNSESRDDVKTALRDEVEVEVGGESLPTFDFSEEQANHIVSMQLGSLTSMEAAETEAEYKDVQAAIKRLETILGDQSELDAVIESELPDIKDEYVDNRRTSFVTNTDEIIRADLILEEDAVVIASEDDYIKRIPVSRPHNQHRGGKDVIGADLKEGDNVSPVFVMNTHDDLFCFTNHEQVYQLKVYQAPETSRTVRGKSAVNLLDSDDGEEIMVVVNHDDLEDIEGYLTMAARNGYIKRTGIGRSQNILLTGIITTKLDEGDELVDVEVTGGESDLVAGTERGMSIRFDEDEVRAMGRSARGVRGIKLKGNDAVADVAAIDEDHHSWILTVTENGYGKCVDLDAYRTQSRNGRGLVDIKANEWNSPVCAINTVDEGDHLVVMFDEGQILRTPVKNISTVGRNTMGVIVMKLDEGNNVASVNMIPAAMTTEGEELDGANSMEEDVETNAKTDAKADTDDE